MDDFPTQLTGNKGSNLALPTQENGTKIEHCCGVAHECNLRGNEVGELTCSAGRERLREGDGVDLGQNF